MCVCDSVGGSAYDGSDGPSAREAIHRVARVGEPLDAQVDAALVLDGGEDLLDVGCGKGDFLGRLVLGGHRGRLVGADVNEDLVTGARATTSGAEFLMADAASLPLADASFDRVTARHVLFHLPDIPRALAEARRVLRPGGRFLAVTNSSTNLEEFWAVVREALGDEPAFAPLFRPGAGDEEQLSDLVRQAFGSAALSHVEEPLDFSALEVPLRYLGSYRSHYRIRDADWRRGMESAAAAFQSRIARGHWLVVRRVALVSADKE